MVCTSPKPTLVGFLCFQKEGRQEEMLPPRSVKTGIVQRIGAKEYFHFHRCLCVCAVKLWCFIWRRKAFIICLAWFQSALSQIKFAKLGILKMLLRFRISLMSVPHSLCSLFLKKAISESVELKGLHLNKRRGTTLPFSHMKFKQLIQLVFL